MSSLLFSSKAGAASTLVLLISAGCATSPNDTSRTTGEVATTATGPTNEAPGYMDASSGSGRSDEARTSGSIEYQDDRDRTDATTTTDSPATLTRGDGQVNLDASAISDSTEATTADSGEPIDGGSTRDAQTSSGASEGGAASDTTDGDNPTSGRCGRGESYYYPGCGVEPNPLEAGCYQSCKGASDRTCREGTTCAVADVNPCVCNDLPPGAGCCAACGAQVWLCQSVTLR